MAAGQVRKNQRAGRNKNALELKVFEHSGVQDAEDADDRLLAAEAEMNGSCVAREEGRVCGIDLLDCQKRKDSLLGLREGKRH